MTLINAMDIVVAQVEKAMGLNGRERNSAFSTGDINYYNRTERFSRRLYSLYNKLIVARAEVTDLFCRGCTAVTADDLPNDSEISIHAPLTGCDGRDTENKLEEL